MPALLLYLLQVNLGFAVLYLVYHVFLRPITFYQLNRWFLLGGLLLASVFPLVDSMAWFTPSEPLYATLATFSGTWEFPAAAPTQTGFDVWQLPVVLFWAGFAVMALRLSVQVASLWRLHRQSRRASYEGIPFRELPVPFPPFSFGPTIYFNPSLHPQRDWLPILRHEYTHVRQWHSVDILLIELLCLVHWFNPAIWLLRVALKQNLEFLTDQQTLAAGIDRKQYQFSLLQTAGAPPVNFTSSFNYHSLKHRISMMNKTPSTKVQQLRFLVALPLVAFSLFSLQGMATATSAPWESPYQDGPAKKITGQPEDYDTFMERNPTVARLGWNQKTFFVHLKNGKTETYPRTPQGLAAAAKKYGPLPPPPPPPPAPPLPGDAPLAPAPPPPPMNVTLTKEFKERNPTVKGISAASDGFHVILNSGEVESFDNTTQGRAAFEKKFGQLPPPPPPVRIKKSTAPNRTKN